MSRVRSFLGRSLDGSADPDSRTLDSEAGLVISLRAPRLPRVLLASLLLVLLGPAPLGWSAEQVEIVEFPSAEVEARYRSLIDEFRCPKCLNTNLSGSDAPIAKDLRNTVRRLLLEEGFEDQQIRDYLQERYGDFVLYDPPFKPGTWALWLLPVVFVLCGLWALARVVRTREDVALSEAEQARVQQILKEIES